MEALVEFLKGMFGKKWVWVAASLLPAFLTYSWYQSEQTYHRWAGSYNVHHFQPDSVEYKDGFVRVLWVSWPKTAAYGFEEQYILHRAVGEPIGIFEIEHPTPRARPYRTGYETDEANMKFCNCLGSWIDVGKLEPGIYQLEIRYDYDPWWLPDWSADQRIVFTVE